jgi:hypothetical protein
VVESKPDGVVSVGSGTGVSYPVVPLLSVLDRPASGAAPLAVPIGPVPTPVVL